MPGLMPSQTPPAAAPAAPAPAQAPVPGEEEMAAGGQEASPEEQAQYEEIVARGLMLIFDAEEGIRPGIRQMLDAGGDDPGTALGQAAGLVIARVEDAAAKDGVEIPDDMREAAAAEIFENLADAASEAGIHDFRQDDAAFQKAFLIAADTMRLQAQESGRLDPEKAKMDMEELAGADREGRLDQIMQGLGGENQGRPPAPQAPGGVA
jgi:hypothetical protein